MVLAMYVVTPCTSRSADVKGKNIVLKHWQHTTQVNDEALGLFATGEEARCYGLNCRSSCQL